MSILSVIPYSRISHVFLLTVQSSLAYSPLLPLSLSLSLSSSSLPPLPYLLSIISFTTYTSYTGVRRYVETCCGGSSEIFNGHRHGGGSHDKSRVRHARHRGENYLGISACSYHSLSLLHSFSLSFPLLFPLLFYLSLFLIFVTSAPL